MSIKIAHEAPISIFEEVNTQTDYSYALVHLFEEKPEYYAHFEKAVEEGREVILDNSIFELEEAFDVEKFAGWIQKLTPTWYIVPDSLENMYQTTSKMEEWNKKYASKVPGKKIGVVQGKTYQEIVSCYNYMAEVANVDMIAISFDYSHYTKTMPHPNKYVSWMLGRVQLLTQLLNQKIIRRDIPHHLLGVALPQEGLFYKGQEWDWIYSMDTSNPIVHGIQGIEYEPYGLLSKQSVKLFTLIDAEITEEQRDLINANIQTFKTFWN